MKTVVARLQDHWPEYLSEALGLGLFMISASAFGVLLEHPDSPARQALPDAFTRRALMGLAMGLTAIALIYSPWGKRSGAHYNPAVTLTFFRLGKVARADAYAYIVAQFIGGALGVAVASWTLGSRLAYPSVNYVVTRPGAFGAAVALVSEIVITALLMTVVLRVSASRWTKATGVCAAICVALFITFEAPLSGMSLNPARTFASALGERDWTALWIYFVAPPIGMLSAAYFTTRGGTRPRKACAKLDHDPAHRCIFCEHQRENR